MKRYETIEVPLPENIEKKDLSMFKGRQSYRYHDTGIKNIRNAFVSHEGLVLKNYFLLQNSAFNLFGFEDKTFYLKFWKLALEQYFVSTFGKSLEKKHLPEGEFLHVFTKWFGYFFWLTDSLPKLIKTQHLHKTLRLIFPEGWTKISYVNESLELFPDLELEKIPSGFHLQVKNLVLPETRKWSNAFNPSEIKIVRDFMFSIIKHKEVIKNFGERIYISRAKAKKRKPLNNDEVENMVKKFGFVSVCLEDFSLLDQVSVLQNARFLIGLHGAGLANLMFMREAGVVLELSPQVKKQKDLRIPFWRLANAIKAKYFVQFCDIEQKANEDEYDSNIIVNIETLQKNIVSMLKHDNKKGLW